MNTTRKPVSNLCKAARGAGIVRMSTVLALALGAAHAGATTYTVPLQFNITLAAPTCSLTLGGITANASTPNPAGATVNLTPIALAATASPKAILNAMTSLTNLDSSSAGLQWWGSGFESQRRVASPPTGTVNCDPGTPMIARITRASPSQISLAGWRYMAGTPGGSQSGTLPIGMLMGISNFAGTSGVSGFNGTTIDDLVPARSATADGTDQTLALTAALYTTSNTALTSSYAGLWTYSFNVHLDF